MDQRRLGRDGPLVPVLFLGTWPLGGGMGPVSRATAIATIRHALDLGIGGIDTAEGYGDAEELIGSAISPADRSRTFIATKVSFGPYTHARVRAAVEQSLRRMRTDHVDLLQLHFFPAEVDLREAIDAVLAVRDAGLATHVGLSNFTLPQLEAAMRYARPAALQVPLNLFDRDELPGTIARCSEIGVGVLCHSALAKGLLTGSLTPAATFDERDERSRHPRFRGEVLLAYLRVVERLRALADEGGLGLVELAVAWVLSQAGVTACIAGPSSPDELDAQAAGARARLPRWLRDRATAVALEAPAIGHGTPRASPALPAP